MMRRLLSVAIGLALLAVPAVASGSSDVAFVDPVDGLWYMPDGRGTTFSFSFGDAADTPIVGDWDCDGRDTPGRFRSDGLFYLSNFTGIDNPQIGFFFGTAGDVPLVGDWDGDGCDTVAVYRPAEGNVYLASHNRSFTDFTVQAVLGEPFVADFQGNGTDEVASYRRDSGLVVMGNAQPSLPGSTRALLYQGSSLTSAEVLARKGGLVRLTPLVGEFGTQCGSSCKVSLPGLSAGDEGAWVQALRQNLTSLGFRPGEGDVFDKTLEGAVIAFQKYHRLERDGIFHSDQWQLLGDALAVPFRADSPTRVEVDLERQILFLIVEHQLLGVIPVSSANGETYTSYSGNTATARTPEGAFKFFRSESGWYRSYLGSLYEPYFFYGGYAIHGSGSVPAYPASHGCIRAHIWDQDWLKPQLKQGMEVFVYGVRTAAPSVESLADEPLDRVHEFIEFERLG